VNGHRAQTIAADFSTLGENPRSHYSPPRFKDTPSKEAPHFKYTNFRRNRVPRRLKHVGDYHISMTELPEIRGQVACVADCSERSAAGFGLVIFLYFPCWSGVFVFVVGSLVRCRGVLCSSGFHLMGRRWGLVYSFRAYLAFCPRFTILGWWIFTYFGRWRLCCVRVL